MSRWRIDSCFVGKEPIDVADLFRDANVYSRCITLFGQRTALTFKGHAVGQNKNWGSVMGGKIIK